MEARARLRIISVIVFSASIGLLAACGEFAAARQVMVHDESNLKVGNSLTKYGIEVLGAENPEFESELQKYLVENSRNADAVNDVKGTAILIRNDSEREIVGLALRWTMGGLDARVVPQSRSHPGVLVGMKPLDPAMIGKTSLINIGATQFFDYSGVGSGVQTTAGSGRPQSNFPVSVNVDGVFFDDGSFVGENQTFYFEQISGSVRAHFDFITRIHEARLTGKSDSDFIEGFLAETPQELSFSRDIAGRHFSSAEQAFDLSYSNTLIGFRSHIIRIRSMNRGDVDILDIYRRQKLEDFKILRKVL